MPLSYFRFVVKPSWWRPASSLLGQSSMRPRQPRALTEILACEMPGPRRSAASFRSLDGADMATPASMHIFPLPPPLHLHPSRRGPRPSRPWAHAQEWHPCLWDPCTDKMEASQARQEVPPLLSPSRGASEARHAAPAPAEGPKAPGGLQRPASDLTASRPSAVSKLAAKSRAWFSVLTYMHIIEQMHGVLCRS